MLKISFEAICNRCNYREAKGFITAKEDDNTSMVKIPVCGECIAKEEVDFLEEEF
jgi:hypothetical protein